MIEFLTLILILMACVYVLFPLFRENAHSEAIRRNGKDNCPRCGRKRSKLDKFCSRCGYKF